MVDRMIKNGNNENRYLLSSIIVNGITNTPIKTRRAVSAPVFMLNDHAINQGNNSTFLKNNRNFNNEVFCNVCGVARATIRCLTCFGQTSSEGVTLCRYCALQTCNNHIHTRVSYYVGEKLFCSDNDEHQC